MKKPSKQIRPLSLTREGVKTLSIEDLSKVVGGVSATYTTG